MEVLIGKIVNTYGIKGAVKVYSHTDFPEIRFKKNNSVILCDEHGNNKINLTIDKHFSSKGMEIVSFKEITNINDVLKYLNYEIHCQLTDLNLPNGQYFHFQLIGCKIIYNKQIIGEVIEVLNNNNHYNLRILKENGKTILYPFIDKFLKCIDIDNKKIEIEPIEGMI